MSCCHGRRWSCVAARDATTTLLPRRQWSSVAAGVPAELLPWPLDCLDTISDSDILKRHEMDSLKNEMKSVPDGWKIRTCFRSISWNYWRKGHTVHVDDISADPQHALLLPHLWDSRTEKCILRNLKTTPGFPAFSIYGGDIVYLMSKVGNKDAWMLCVDLGKKSLEVLKPYCASRATYLDETFRNTFISCAFSKYLNTTSSPRPCDAQVAAESAQSGALNDHLSLGDTAPKTQQNTGNGDMMAHTQDTMASISSKPHSSHPV